jgi:hypothetical protein
MNQFLQILFPICDLEEAKSIGLLLEKRMENEKTVEFIYQHHL